jgi:hypothetical protein
MSRAPDDPGTAPDTLGQRGDSFPGRACGHVLAVLILQRYNSTPGGPGSQTKASARAFPGATGRPERDDG